MNAYSNTAFIPQPSAITPGQAAVAQLYNKNPDTEIFSTGVYNWANSDRDPQCSDEASRIFGSNLIDPEDSDYAALMIGNAVLTRSGCSDNPEAYFRAQGWTVPTGYGDYTNLTRMAGQRIIQQARNNYDDYQKRLAEYRKVMTDTLNTLPHEITNSIYRSGALGADALFRAKKLSPEYLENISKFYDKDKAVESHQRALTAWTSFSGFMHSTDSLQSMTREDLRDIAAILTDETGQTDLLALSVLSMLAERRASDMQSQNPDAWNTFADSLQNWGARWADQDAKEKASKWNKMVQGWKDDGIDQNMIDHFSDKRYNDETVETLYGSLQHALDTSLSPSEKADWLAKTMASAAKVTGESIVPSIAALGIGIASRGAGYGAAASTIGSYATNVAINSNSLINAAVAEAYRTGKVNPETYGRQEGSAQAISEGAFDLGTTFPGASKIIGKITNKAAATAAGSRFLTNQYARATLNYLGSGMIQGFGEIAEEELSGKIAASLNTLARENGIVLTPRQYTFGEALRSMKSYEIAGIFGYTWALGMFGIPANYRAARTYAQNTDNLLKAGHSPAAVRDIQSHLFETEDKISAVYADNSLSKAEKQKQVDKLNQDFFKYQQQKAQSDIWDVDPEIIRKRLEKENKKTLTEAELALAIRNNIHTQIFKDAGIIDSTALPGDKHKLTFIQPGEKKEDGTEAPAKITTQEWSNNQLVNWLQIKEAGLLDNSLRKFQALVQAHAGAQTITMGDLVIEFQNMRDTPLAAFAALQKHNAMSEEYIKEMAVTARNMLQSSMDNGMTAQEAAQQPSGILRGVSLGEVAKLDTAIAQRKEQAIQTSEGKDKGISADTSVSFPAMNLRRADGSYLIAYVSGDTNINDMLEDMLETHIKHQLNTGQLTRNQLAAFLKEVDSHLPGKSILPKNKTDYSMSDLVEAYSSLALAHYLYNEQYLPLTQGGHQLMRNIGRVVDTARVLKTLGDSWFTYANSPEGKAYLANGGKDLMTIMQEAGFTFGNILAQARATAQQEQEVIEARNWQPAIEDELDALLEEAEEEAELNEINEQEAKEPITIPADQSITGQEITIEPQQEETIVNSQSSIVNPPDPAADLTGTKATTILSHMRDLIAKGKARAEHFAIVFREIPGLTEAQAIEQGIRPLTQRGEPTAAYTQGKLLAERCTDVQYLLLREGKLTQKAKRDILLNPQDDGNVVTFSIFSPAERSGITALQQLTRTGKDVRFRSDVLNQDILIPLGSAGRLKDPKNQRSKVVEAHGFIHLISMRMAHGETLDEAAYTSVKAVLAAVNGEKLPTPDENTIAFLKLDGYKTVVSLEWHGSKKAWMITGYKEQGEHSSADDKRRALSLAASYALDTFGGLERVGAALDYAIARLAREYKQNNADPKRKPAKTYTATESADILTDGVLEAENAIVTQPDVDFSIRATTPSTLDRFTADPLGERIVHTVRTEARRYARVLGDKTPQEQAMNAIASAESIINAVDKYLHRPDKPVSRRHRDQLTKLRSIIEKYAQIIASGTPRSFKKISPAEQQELEAAIADLEASELGTAETDPALLIEDDKRMNKRTREARSREHHRAIVREAAKGRVYKVLAAMLDTTADALDDYLKDQLLTKLHRLTATVAIKRTPSKRLKGKMTAPMYRELEQAIQLMAYSTRQKEDAIDTILSAHETLAQAIASNDDNLTRGNTLLIELAHQLEQEGTPVTAKNLTAALAAHEARVAIFADINSKDYEQTRTAANAIYHIIRYGRAIWQQKYEAREAEIQVYLRHFLANTTAEQGKANAINEMLDKFKWRDALSLNATMNAAQTLLALSSYEPLRPIMQKVLENYATASVARQKHLQEMRKQELYIFGRILGIKPATQAGYSDKQLREISDKFDTFYTENNKTHDTGITVTWQERNEDGVLETYTSKPLQLTKWEALNLILTYRQQDYQTNAQIHGYTDEVLTKLENFIGTDLMDFGNGIQNALINDGTIAVYEEREGIPMRSNPLYWPGNINLNTLNTTRDEPLTNPYHPAAGHDFLHTRVRHRNEISHMNAFNVWRKAVADRANYVYSDPITTQLESLLARQQFAGRLKTLIGEGLFRQLKATITEIKNAAWQETTLQDVNNTIIATAFASKSLAVLSGNPGSLVRQLSAVANAGLMPGLTPAKLMQYAIGLKQGQGHIGITDILKLDSFTTRERDNAYVNEMIAMGNNAKFSHLMDWAKAGMNAMDKLDLLANAFSAAIVYNHKYDQLKALGTLTEEQIKQQCENAVAVYTKLLAQPLNRTDKSALYWQLGNHALGRAVLFMSSESINKIGMLRANYIRMRNEGKNPAYALGAILGTMGITVGLTAAITEAALALLTGSLPDDDDNIAAWATALWLNASYGQYLGSLPLIGGASDIIFSPYGGYTSGDFRIPGIDTFRYGSKLVQMLTDNKTYTAAQWDKETTRFMRDFTAVLGFSGGAYSRWQWYSHFAAFSHSLTAALNALYPIARGAEAYSDPVPNGKRKPRRSKSKIEQWLTPESK